MSFDGDVVVRAHGHFLNIGLRIRFQTKGWQKNRKYEHPFLGHAGADPKRWEKAVPRRAMIL